MPFPDTKMKSEFTKDSAYCLCDIQFIEYQGDAYEE